MCRVVSRETSQEWDAGKDFVLCRKRMLIRFGRNIDL